MTGTATDLLDASNSKCMEELSAAAATELHGAANSMGAFNLIDVKGIVPAEGHGKAALLSVYSVIHSFVALVLIHCTIPIHACAHPRLDNCGVGSGVGVGVGGRAGVSCVVPSGAVDDVDDACMDGFVYDVIHTGSNSVIQGFSEYHDSSCARMNALQNSRVERGHHVRGGIKRPSTGSLCKVTLSAGKKRPLSKQQPVKVHDGMWASLLKNQSPRFSCVVEIIPGCAVTVACPSCPDNSPVSPGPGRLFGSVWSMVVPWCRPRREYFSSLDAAGDLEKKGSYHTAWSVFVYLFVRVRARPRYRATHWRAVLATASMCVEGCRTRDAAVVC